MAASRELFAAQAFLAPVLHRDHLSQTKGQSIIQRLATGNQIPYSASSPADARKPVVRRALGCLLDVHRALCRDDASEAEVEDVLLDSGKRRVVDALLDLIALEGIYPNLLPGVGVPIRLRVRSVLREGGGVHVQSVEAAGVGVGVGVGWEDDGLLIDVVEQLRGLTKGGGKGLSAAFRARTLVDLLAAVGQLAFGAGGGAGGGGNVFYGTVWRGVVSSTPTAVLWRTMMPLLHKDCPSWLQAQITTTLATLPLRPDGVKQFILFRAQSSGSDVQAKSGGTFPAISLDVLQVISKLLSSPPKALSPPQYFRGIAPQLLELLDEEDDEARRVASFVIASGILSKRTTGAPGSIGWELFVKPIHTILNPDLAPPGDEDGAVHRTDSSNDIPTLSTNGELQRAAGRLACLTLIHPNPPLTQRLLKPLVLPLWGLACRCTRNPASTALREKCLAMVSVYLKFANSTTGFSGLVDQLLYDGSDQWSYHVGLEDVELRRPEADQLRSTDFGELLEMINRRVSTYLELFDFCDVSDVEVGDIFAYVASRWLRRDRSDGHASMLDAKPEDARYKLVYTRLTQEMIKTYQSRISKQPDKLLRLLTDVLEDAIQERERQDANDARPTLSSLRSIVKAHDAEPLGSSLTAEETSDETLELALSLLSTILSAPDFATSDPNVPAFLTTPLEWLTSDPFDNLPPSIPPLARRVYDALSTSSSNTKKPLQSASSFVDSDPDTHALALSHLASPLPPIRYEGLSLLGKLIASHSPTLPLASTTTLLLSLLADPEEHIYLGAIATLASLATLHPRPTIRRLVEAYVDPTEDRGLDARLRVGEALRRVVEGLGEALTGDAASAIGEGLIAVAGRRGRRAKELKKEHERIAREGRRGAGSSPPTLDLSLSGGESESDDDDDDGSFHSSDAASRKAHKARLASILAGWRAPAGEEDVRVRTSALSILGIALETNRAGFAPNVVERAIEIALSALQMERGEECAILRRAAAVVLDVVLGSGGIGIGGRETSRNVLRYVLGLEGDEGVRGMVEGLVARLEEEEEGGILGLGGGGEGRRRRTAMGGGGGGHTLGEGRVERARGILAIGRRTSSLRGTAGDGGWRGAIEEIG